MPNQIKQEMTPKSPTSSSQSQPQSPVSTKHEPKPTAAPTTAPSRVEPHGGTRNGSVTKTRDQDKPLEIAVESEDVLK